MKIFPYGSILNKVELPLFVSNRTNPNFFRISRYAYLVNIKDAMLRDYDL